MHISFVILHYLTDEDTIECINSILNNIDTEDYSIIVVDNASPNSSGTLLKNMFENEARIEVILNETNLGFAKGNNVGFYKAKYAYKADFIILMNNDMYIEQTNFFDTIIKSYNSSNFGVMGPDIISVVDNRHQNPQPIRIVTTSDAWFQLIRHTVLLFVNYLKLENYTKKIINKIKGETAEHKNIDYSTEKFNVQLHGSCLIFSPMYIEKFDGLFDKTFMYFEEDILFYLCRENNFLTYYNNKLEIYHKEDSATNKYLSNTTKKNRFIYKNSIVSIYELIKLMK